MGFRYGLLLVAVTALLVSCGDAFSGGEGGAGGLGGSGGASSSVTSSTSSDMPASTTGSGGNSPDGTFCGKATECQSGHCVDGVCCNEACATDCLACIGAKTGGMDGECAGVLAQTDPDDDCADFCQDNLAFIGVCSGDGACIATEPQNCGAYLCVDAGCPTSCGTVSDCVAGASCTSNECVVLGANGDACTEHHLCTSGFCVEAICCDEACGDTCMTCDGAVNTSGVDGTCDPAKQGTNPNQQCPQQQTCDGAGSCG